MVYPSQLIPVSANGLLISIFLMFVARPISVYLCLMPTKMNWREKTMVAWVGLRGAVPIILATFPLLAGIPQANVIFNIVFFIVLTSVLFQGTTIRLISKILKVDAPFKDKRYYPIEFEHTGNIDADLVDLIIPYESTAVGKSIIKIGIPSGCLIVLLSRDDNFFIPNGATILQGGDVLLVLANKTDRESLQAILAKQKS